MQGGRRSESIPAFELEELLTPARVDNGAIKIILLGQTAIFIFALVGCVVSGVAPWKDPAFSVDAQSLFLAMQIALPTAG